MPTCGECILLAQTKQGGYICVGKMQQCLAEKPTPQADASQCIRFAPKNPPEIKPAARG